MAISQNRSLRKETGARYKKVLLKKRQYSQANEPNLPKIGTEKKRLLEQEEEILNKFFYKQNL